MIGAAVLHDSKNLAFVEIMLQNMQAILDCTACDSTSNDAIRDMILHQMHSAVCGDNHRFLDAVVKLKGCDLERTDAMCNTPYHRAAETGSGSMVEALKCMRVPDVNKKNASGETALHWAVMHYYWDRSERRRLCMALLMECALSDQIYDIEKWMQNVDESFKLERLHRKALRPPPAARPLQPTSH